MPTVRPSDHRCDVTQTTSKQHLQVRAAFKRWEIIRGVWTQFASYLTYFALLFVFEDFDTGHYTLRICGFLLEDEEGPEFAEDAEEEEWLMLDLDALECFILPPLSFEASPPSLVASPVGNICFWESCSWKIVGKLEMMKKTYNTQKQTSLAQSKLFSLTIRQ